MKKKNLELKKLNLEKMTVSSLNEVTGGDRITATICSLCCIPDSAACPVTKLPNNSCNANTTTVSF